MTFLFTIWRNKRVQFGAWKWSETLTEESGDPTYDRVGVAIVVFGIQLDAGIERRI